MPVRERFDVIILFTVWSLKAPRGNSVHITTRCTEWLEATSRLHRYSTISNILSKGHSLSPVDKVANDDSYSWNPLASGVVHMCVNDNGEIVKNLQPADMMVIAHDDSKLDDVKVIASTADLVLSVELWCTFSQAVEVPTNESVGFWREIAGCVWTCTTSCTTVEVSEHKFCKTLGGKSFPSLRVILWIEPVL